MKKIHTNYPKGVFLAICASLFMLPACRGKGGAGGASQATDEEIRLNTELALIPEGSIGADVQIESLQYGLRTTFKFKVWVESEPGERPWVAQLQEGELSFDDGLDSMDPIKGISAKITQVENMGKNGITLKIESTSSPQGVDIDQLYIEFDPMDDSLKMRTGTIKSVNAATYTGEQNIKGNLFLSNAVITVQFY